MPQDFMQDVAQRLQGVSANLQGRGLEYNQQQQQQQALNQQRDTALEEKKKLARQQAMAVDTRALRGHLDAGNLDAAGRLLDNRMQTLMKLDPSADPTDTVQAQQLLQEDPEALNAMVSALDDKFTAMDLVTKYEGPGERKGKSEDRALRQRELELKEKAEERKGRDLSATAEKALIEAQDKATEAAGKSREYDTLAQDFENMVSDAGGVGVSLNEFVKTTFGGENAESDFRRRFNSIRFGEAVRNLPPGPATDKDVENALKGLPPGNASPEYIASFLRGAAKLAKSEAAYNSFKSDYIGNSGSSRGMGREWRRKIKTDNPKFKGKTITLGDVYQTAINRDITPEEVAEKLGIKL